MSQNGNGNSGDFSINEMDLVKDVQDSKIPEKEKKINLNTEKTIEVHVEQEDGGKNVITVHIKNEVDVASRPFLGGYRHKKTRKEYHHSVTQTFLEISDPKRYNAYMNKIAAAQNDVKDADDGNDENDIGNENSKNFGFRKEKFHRECQTVSVATRSQSTNRECGTQMNAKGIYVDDGEEDGRVIDPRRYFTSDDLLELKTNKTICIQRYARGWLARRRAERLRAQTNEKKHVLMEEEKKKQEENEKKKKKDIERRMYPKTSTDFNILYLELEAWRLQETKKIDDTEMTKEERHVALERLLAKETKLLQTIDRLKIDADKSNRETKVEKKLDLMSSSKRWAMSDGEVMEVETPFTTRAKELTDLYHGLRTPLLTLDQRMEVLLHVKWTVKEFDCNLTREIIELIDREADLLNRGRSEKSLEAARKRLANMFLQFLETPEFNPEAGRFQVIPVLLNSD